MLFTSQTGNYSYNNQIYRAACYINISQFEKALEDANQCIKLKPAWFRGYQRKGMILMRLNKYEESIEAYKEGLKHNPEDKILKEGLSEVETLNKNPFMKNYDKLKTDSRTAKHMSDPAFVNLLDFAMKDQKMLFQLMQTDSRFNDVFAVLTGLDLGKMQEETMKTKKTSEEKEKVNIKKNEEVKIKYI